MDPADADTEVSLAENPDLSKVPPSKNVAGQNIAKCVFPTAEQCFLLFYSSLFCSYGLSGLHSFIISPPPIPPTRTPFPPLQV